MLKYNTIGYSRSGDMKGFYVKIIQDSTETGGCYLLFSKDFDNKEAEGYDEWYFDDEAILSRLSELNVDW